MQPQRPAKPKNPRYRPTTPLVHDDGSAIAPEWKLHCLHCDYDLTGLTTRRCPECGQRFDPHEVWVAGKHKQADLKAHTPAYVVYTGFGILIALLLPWFSGRYWSLMPVAAMPVFEATAFFFKFSPATVRPIIAALAFIACIVVRAW